MAVTQFRPAPGNYGEVYLDSTQILPATPLTSAGIARLLLPTTRDAVFFKGGSLRLSGTVPAGTGNCNARIVKRTVGGTFLPVSTTVSLFGRATWDEVVLLLLGGIAEGNLCLQPSEHFLLEVDNTGGTVTVQPTALGVAIKLAVLR